MLITVVILTVIFALLFTFSRFTGREEKQSFFLKCLASLGFLAIGLTAYFYNPDCGGLYFNLMITALALGFIGDVSLGLKSVIPERKTFFRNLGIVLFMLGHIIYTVNYFVTAGAIWWLFLVNIGAAAGIMFMTRVLGYKLSRGYIILGLFYSYAISLMLMSAINFAIVNGTSSGAVMVLTGGIAFYVSDSLLSASYFKKQVRSERHLNLIVHFTYYLAQILLALSVYFV